VRKLALPHGHEALMSDTVGFVRDLPHEVIEAFKSTLEEVSDADVEPLDFADVGLDAPAPPSHWGQDATLAGAPAPDLPGVAGLDPDEDFDLDVAETGLDDDVPPGLELEIDHTVRAMDEEPELPVPKSDRDIDLDARTVAGTTSDYLVAGIRPPEGGTYDADAAGAPPSEPDYEVPAAAPGRRGQEQLGAIKLNRVAVSRGLGSEERTEGEVPAYREDSFEAEIGELPGVQEDLPIDIGFDEDAPPVEPSPLEDPSPPSEPELPVALPGPTAAQARDEYSALLAPKLPTPINASNQGDTPPVPPVIGSTNVPPANLSLSQMLEHPSRASRSRIMATPRGVSTAGRSASIVGRQIREVARDGEAPSGPPMSGIMPPPAAPPPAPVEPMPPPGAPELMQLPGPPPARASKKRLLLVAALVVLVLLLGGVAYLSYPLLMGPSEPRLTIKTSPAGAKVYVDNALQRGTTPLTISGLQPGVTYTVRLVRDGFEPVSQPVRLRKDRPLIWRIPLKPKRTAVAPAPEQ